MFSSILPLILEIIVFIFKKINASEEQKKKFLEFLEAMEPHNESCSRIYFSYKAQHEENLKKVSNANNK